MTAETAFKFCRAYKLFYQGRWDFKKYGSESSRIPPLITQPDRRYYHRFAQRMSDAQIHALYTLGYFFNPRAHVSAFATPEAERAALVFASRAENGRTILENDLYTLAKHLATADVDAWLYGEITEGTRALMPGCLEMIINGELALDVASLILLIPQPSLNYHWVSAMASRADAALGLGPAEWVARLQYADRLILAQRPGWRMLSHDLAKSFWTDLGVQTLAPKSVHSEARLDA